MTSKNKLQWNHIMDKQPGPGENIIQCDLPIEGWYTMGMRVYQCYLPFEELIKINKENDWPLPNFYWISTKDFPFPKEKE